MMEAWLVIVIHQIVFQGMFVAKNLLLGKKTKKQIRGKNKEATISIIFFAVFISVALIISIFKFSMGDIQWLQPIYATGLACVLMGFNLIVSSASLIHLKDSWRVGVLEDQKTTLITQGIYGRTRNPYFVSYLLMFSAYTILLQNLVLCGLSIVGFSLIHWMILKEETYLQSVHGASYEKYKKKVPRYF